MHFIVNVPGVEFLPLVRVLHQFQQGAVYLLPELREGLCSCLQGWVGRVAFRKLLTELLHQLQPLLTEGLRTFLSEETLQEYGYIQQRTQLLVQSGARFLL